MIFPSVVALKLYLPRVGFCFENGVVSDPFWNGLRECCGTWCGLGPSDRSWELSESG